MTDKLLPYQIDHVERLVYSLTSYNRALDASDTGTGKTYTAIAVCKIFGFIPLIVCPKSVIDSWLKVLAFMECEFFGIANYESIQNCKYYNSDGKKVKTKFLTMEEINNKIVVKKNKQPNVIDLDDSTSSDEEIKYEYKWNKTEMPANIIVIVDEAHRCKNIKTNNGKILARLSEIPDIKILILSATVVDKPKFFMLTGYVLGLYSPYAMGKSWMKESGKTKQHNQNHNQNQNQNQNQNIMQGVHKKIYPEYASRMKISNSNIKTEFPDNHITAECIQMDNSVEIQKQYELIKAAAEELKNKETNSGNALASILFARQRIEMLKIPAFIQLVKSHIDENKSVAIFVNFTDTLKNLAEKLQTKCLIYGEQSIEERVANIANFSNDTERIIICNIKSGGCGISLHDTIGNFPRVSIISPTWSAQDIIQVLGRIYRAKTKTKVQQRIIFCSNTIEVDVCENLKEKISNISMLNDGDVSAYKIVGLIEQIEPKEIIQDDVPIPEPIDNEFNNIFGKLTNLYERRDNLTKELNKIKVEIEETENRIYKSIS